MRAYVYVPRLSLRNEIHTHARRHTQKRGTDRIQGDNSGHEIKEACINSKPEQSVRPGVTLFRVKTHIRDKISALVYKPVKLHTNFILLHKTYATLYAIAVGARIMCPTTVSPSVSRRAVPCGANVPNHQRIHTTRIYTHRTPTCRRGP